MKLSFIFPFHSLILFFSNFYLYGTQNEAFFPIRALILCQTINICLCDLSFFCFFAFTYLNSTFPGLVLFSFTWILSYRNQFYFLRRLSSNFFLSLSTLCFTFLKDLILVLLFGTNTVHVCAHVYTCAFVHVFSAYTNVHFADIHRLVASP